MSAPVISWMDDTNASEVTDWTIGVVKAGIADNDAPTKTILIWNNKDGSDDVSDMQETKITTTDGAADTLDVVKDQWIECKVDSITGDGFSPIGGNATKDLTAKGQATGVIKGTKNSGNVSDTDNHVKITLKAKPPLNVVAGKRNFKTRVSYYYT